MAYPPQTRAQHVRNHYNLDPNDFVIIDEAAVLIEKKNAWASIDEIIIAIKPERFQQLVAKHAHLQTLYKHDRYASIGIHMFSNVYAIPFEYPKSSINWTNGYQNLNTTAAKRSIKGK